MRLAARYLLLITFVACPSVGLAATLAQYSFDTYTPTTNANGAASSGSGPTVSGATAGAFSFTINSNEAGSGLTDTGFSTSTSNHAFVRSSATGADSAAALADDDYFTFTVTADSGRKLNLTSLSLSLGGSNTSGSGRLDSSVYVIIDGSVAGSTVASFNDNTGTAFNSRTIDLSAPAYQGLSAITIRLALSDNLTSNNAVERLDNVVLNGDVIAAPEPGAVGVLVVGASALLRRRRPRVLAPVA